VLPDQAAADLVERVEGLLDEADAPTLRAVTAVVELYGEGLARMVAACDASVFADDPLVAHLLMLHDLHPVPVEDRVRGAIDAAGGGAELLFIEDGVVHMRAQAGSCATGATAATKQQAIADAVQQAAPEVSRVEVMDVPQPLLVLPQAGG
jgi:Fe-S cluster biogenesis protein NfuA